MRQKLAREKIEKPEDAEWRNWFNQLSQKDHETYLEKLGLTKEDRDGIEEIKELENNPIVEESQKKKRH